MMPIFDKGSDLANRRKKILYNEGDWFLVPVYRSYAIGLVARKGTYGILAGYFFGPVISTIPDLKQLSTLTPNDAVYRSQFGDVGLKSGEWPIIGRVPDWDRNQWALHRFLRGNPLDGQVTVVEYDPDNPAIEIRTIRSTASELANLPADGMGGHIFVEQKLASYFGLPTERVIAIDSESDMFSIQANDLTRMTRKSALALFFDIDVAADIKVDFTKAVRRLRDPVTAAAQTLEANADAAADPDDGPVIRIALAILLLDRDVKDHDLIAAAKAEAKSATFRSHWIGADQDAEQQKIEKALSILLDV